MTTTAANHVTTRALNRRHHMDLVLTVLVSAHQEFQVSQEALVPRDQQVLRDHPVSKDLKDPRAHEETRVMKVFVENKVHRVQWDLKDPRVYRVHPGTTVMQVLREVKVPQVPSVLQDPWDVTGNSALLTI